MGRRGGKREDEDDLVMSRGGGGVDVGAIEGSGRGE